MIRADLIFRTIRGAILGSGVLRYPSLPEFLAQYVSEGADAPPLAPDLPFPGEGFGNATCFIDYMTPVLAGPWRAKLAGDESCGRPDWDRAGTLLGNWYRADASFANMRDIERNAVSFGPHNRDPLHKVQIGIGASFVDNWPASIAPVPESARLAAADRLTRQLVFLPDRTQGSQRNPDPAAVGVGDCACYDVPDPVFGGTTHRLLAHHYSVDGMEHLELRYGPASCAALPNWSLFTQWWGDYVR